MKNKTSNKCSQKSGFTLIELVLASVIMVLLFQVFFEGMMQCRRFSEENKNKLLADSFAWDFLWMAFNKHFDAIPPTVEYVALKDSWLEEQLPDLHEPAFSYSIVKTPTNATISVVQMSWKCGSKTRTLFPNDGSSPYSITRSSYERVVTKE